MEISTTNSPQLVSLPDFLVAIKLSIQLHKVVPKVEKPERFPNWGEKTRPDGLDFSMKQNRGLSPKNPLEKKWPTFKISKL